MSTISSVQIGERPNIPTINEIPAISASGNKALIAESESNNSNELSEVLQSIERKVVQESYHKALVEYAKVLT